jgi:[histone H3]-lysine36 N-dimethyltransferase NSD2
MMQELDEETACGICNDDDPDGMLLCDGACCMGFHMHCMGYSRRPEGRLWYCRDCAESRVFED